MKRLLAILLSLVMSFILVESQVYAIPENQNLEKQEYLVQFDVSSYKGLSEDAINTEFKNVLNSINIEEVDILKAYHLLPVYCVRLSEEQAQVLKELSIVKAVEPNYKVKASEPITQMIESEEVKPLQDTIPWGIERVQATDAHYYGYYGSGIKVAVLDTGIDGGHYDLYVRGGYSVFNDSPYYDGYGHGTHVAGIVAALENSYGVLGVAPDVSLYSVKVLGNDGYGSISGIVEGIEWAVNNNMNVINMSLGSSSYSSIFEDYCNYAYNSGLLIVAAAGNSGNSYGTGDSVEYPARYSSVMAVAATDYYDKRASFSSTGSDVEIAAPGVDIYSTYPDNNYAYMSGTSMACPHVAGAAALVWSANPNLTNIQVRQKLVNSAKYLGNRYHYGAGLVQAYNAIYY
ncbi:S8 family peptidase [Sporanaerobacter acetigenes]|uniref:S8 family peptidase n=1 Tax=Sporanaerobacter acetigenes TaxID=165813 RepID=UPI001042C5DA|nr:S8 family peptidase [Sporanaerobacter acetigenes]